MSNQLQKPETQLTVKTLFAKDEVRRKFAEMLGKKAQGFITSVLQIVAQNKLLAKAEPASVYHAAAVAATLDLPINDNLGFAYIIPYNQRQQDGQFKTVAQFQMGYKGFIQLAQRSGVFQTISSTPVYEGQVVEQNPLTGFKFDFTQRKSDVVVGYAAYFRLMNGFEKTLFMSIDELKKHGQRYSKTFGNKNGLWTSDFDAMASKTVIKLLLSKFAPLSVEMQRAVITDQSVINDEDATDVTYVDNEEVDVNKEAERVVLMINDARTVDDLKNLEPSVPAEQMDLFKQKMAELS